MLIFLVLESIINLLLWIVMTVLHMRPVKVIEVQSNIFFSEGLVYFS